MARQLFCGRRLLFHTRQSCINTSPTRRTGGPDRHRRVGKIWIVESPSPNEDQMGSCLSLAKERSAAIGTEPTVHSIATVRHTRKVARLPYDLERCGAKASANRSAACAQVLAIAAPAHARGDWRFRALPANRAAKTPACHCHCPSKVRNAGLRRADRTLAPCLRGRLRSNARRPACTGDLSRLVSTICNSRQESPADIIENRRRMFSNDGCLDPKPTSRFPRKQTDMSDAEADA